MLKKHDKRILYIYYGKVTAESGYDIVVKQQLVALAENGWKVFFVARSKFVYPNVINITFPFRPDALIQFFRKSYRLSLRSRFFGALGNMALFLIPNISAFICWQQQSGNSIRYAKKKNIPTLMNCSTSFPCKTTKIKNPGKTMWPIYDHKDIVENFVVADTLLAPSEYSVQTYKNIGIDPSRIACIGRGVDATRYQFAERGEVPFRAVFFGFVCERKGIFQLLNAWRQANIENGELWIIGRIDESIKERLLKIASKNTIFFGFVHNAEHLLKQCHVQVLLTKMEGMAKTLIEGAATGLVTITTRESGFPILDNINGYYVGKNSHQVVAKKLLQLSSNFEEWKRMSSESAKFVRENLTWDIFKTRFIAAVERHLPDQSNNG